MLHPTPGYADARSADCPCSRSDLLLGLDGVHVEHVDRRDDVLDVTVSTRAHPTRCLGRGVLVSAHGRRRRLLRDVPGMTEVRVVWGRGESDCPRKTFVEHDSSLLAPRGSAVAWATGQLRLEHATIQGLARLVEYAVAGYRARAGAAQSGTSRGSRASPASVSLSMSGITSTRSGGDRRG